VSDWSGRSLAKVVLQQRLGRGGMADVYRGQHTGLNRPVAVKVLHSFLAEEAARLARFHAEAQVVAGLRHPNIVQVFDFDIADDRPYIVMEWLDGPPLDQYLDHTHAAGRRLPPETTARLITALASALDYAHARNLVHRDVKPANVVLRREAGRLDLDASLPLDVEPVLTDFGVARLQQAAALSSTLSGTPAYLSPEQAQGKPVDARADVYSLGVVLYELLAGHPLFEAAGEAPDGNVLALLLKHISEPPPRIAEVSAAVWAVTARALAKAPEQRFARAGDLAEALLDAIFGLSARPRSAETPPLAGLLDTLELLVAQAQAYERALPASNGPARAAVNRLSALARQAANEARDLAAAARPAPPTAHPFSPREFEVLGLAAQGLTNKEIAYRLSLSERTVQFHLNSVFNKTGTGSRTEAVALALQSGWLGRPAGR